MKLVEDADKMSAQTPMYVTPDYNVRNFNKRLS